MIIAPIRGVLLEDTTGGRALRYSVDSIMKRFS